MAVIDFTPKEKIAVADVLLQMICADGEIDEGEKQYMYQLQEALEISNADIEKALNEDTLSSLIVIRDMTDTKKEVVTIMMHEMMCADGEIDEGEVQVLLWVARLCGLPLPE